MQKGPTVDEAVHSYVEAHRSAFQPISTSAAAGAVRNAVPEAEHTDAEIADLVAAAAVRAGVSVHFDQHIDDKDAKQSASFNGTS